MIPLPVPSLQRVAAGEFWMGENPNDKFANDTERPRHRVVITREFWLGVYPVTVGEFRAFIPEHGSGEDDCWPVTGVSWRDAAGYCAWLCEITGDAYRLPSEAEWEYAARSGSVTAYPWGDEITVENANYLYDEGGSKVGLGRRTPVGAYPATAFGLHDMHGNVGEWVEDGWHATYDGAPTDGAPWIDAGGSDRRRVLRGGAWDYLPRLLRSCWRDALPETAQRDNLGFRVACNI